MRVGQRHPHAATRSTGIRRINAMNLIRSVVVFDAANLHTESAFWAGILGGHVFEDESSTASSTPPESGGSACSSRPTTFPLTGRMGRLSKPILTSTWRTPNKRTTRRWRSVRACFWQHQISTAPKGPRCTPTQPVTRSASDGGILLERRLPDSLPRGWDNRRLARWCLLRTWVGLRSPLTRAAVDPSILGIPQLEHLIPYAASLSARPRRP